MKDQSGSLLESLRIRFDYNNAMAPSLGALGIDDHTLASYVPLAFRAHDALLARRNAGQLEWTELPYRDQSAMDVAAFAQRVRDRAETFVVLGIGGSALGNIALHRALNHPFYNQLPANQRGPRLFVLDNVDPDLNAGLLDVIDLDKTVFNVITKSGSTAETMSQFLIFKEELRKRLGPRFRDHIIATTDPATGILRSLAAAEGFVTFDVPTGVGGRFSVLSPVGLLSAAVSRVDIEELLAGAAFADHLCALRDVSNNPAYMNALLQYVAYTRLGRQTVVMMPYAQALDGIADWFRQLWAESLGKRLRRDGQEVRVGPTPIKAVGATDQHSQVQLYVEGPLDKVINLLAVDRWSRTVPIPSSTVDGLAYLGGRTLNELMNVERIATAIALTEAGQINVTLSLPEISAFTIGELLFMLEIQTAFSGELYDVNAFDQPGVEAGKIATSALLGRRGYDRERSSIMAQQAHSNPQYVI